VDSIRPGDPVKILAMHDLRRDFRPRGKGCFQPGQGILRTLERGNETALVVQCFNDGVNAEDDVIGFPFTYPARGPLRWFLLAFVMACLLSSFVLN
jgi:hypothetical protein